MLKRHTQLKEQKRLHIKDLSILLILGGKGMIGQVQW